MVYCAKAHQMSHENNTVVSKYLSQLSLFLPLCLGNSHLLEDYTQVCRLYKENYESWRQQNFSHNTNNIMRVGTHE